MDFVPFVFSGDYCFICCIWSVNSFVCALSYCFILFLFEDYLLLRLVLVDCRSSLAIKLQVIQKVMWFTYVTNAARNYGYKCFFGESY